MESTQRSEIVGRCLLAAGLALLMIGLQSTLAGQARADVLHNQNSGFPYSISAQDYGQSIDPLDLENSDTFVADDFTVPSGRTWTLESVLLRGFTTHLDKPPSGYNLNLYSDAAGKPGQLLSGRNGAIESGYPNPTVIFGDKPLLQAGTYWLEVQANLPYTIDGHQWFWGVNANGPFGNPAYFRNPGGKFPDQSFSAECVEFIIRQDCSRIPLPEDPAPAPDQAFVLNGIDAELTVDPPPGPSAACKQAKKTLSQTKTKLTKAKKQVKKAKKRRAKKAAKAKQKKAQKAVKKAQAKVKSVC